MPADPGEAGKLAAYYRSEALDDNTVLRSNPDGTVSFVTIAPGLIGFELVVAGAGGTRTLTVRDAQHEYVFTES